MDLHENRVKHSNVSWKKSLYFCKNCGIHKSFASWNSDFFFENHKKCAKKDV